MYFRLSALQAELSMMPWPVMEPSHQEDNFARFGSPFSAMTCCATYLVVRAIEIGNRIFEKPSDR